MKRGIPFIRILPADRTAEPSTVRTGTTAPYTPSPGHPHHPTRNGTDRPATYSRKERHGEGQLIRCFLPSNSSAFRRYRLPSNRAYLPARCRISFLRPHAVSRQETRPADRTERHGEGQRIIRCPSLIPDCFRTPGPHAAAPVRQWSGAYSSSLRWSCST